MTTASTAMPQSRIARMTSELQWAITSMDVGELKVWGVHAASRWPAALGRRATNLGKTLTALAQATVVEVSSAVEARKRGELETHLRARGERALQGARELGDAAVRRLGQVADVASRLRANPADVAPMVLGAGLGFLAGSGGLDAEGGLADVGGNGHGSPLSHSVLLGATAEAVIFATMELAALVHDRLPEDHDPLWDALAVAGRKLGQGLAVGVGAGLAYHFGVNDPTGPVAAGSAAAELIDLDKKPDGSD